MYEEKLPFRRYSVEIELTTDGLYFLYFSYNKKIKGSVVISDVEAFSLSYSLGITIKKPEYHSDEINEKLPK